MDWYRQDADMPQHPKTLALSDALTGSIALDPTVLAVGLVTRLRCHVARHCEDGDLSGVHPSVIARWAGWLGDAEECLRLLLSLHILDSEPLRMHGWDRRHAQMRAKRIYQQHWRNQHDGKTCGEGCPHCHPTAESRRAYVGPTCRPARANRTVPIQEALRDGETSVSPRRLSGDCAAASELFETGSKAPAKAFDPKALMELWQAWGQRWGYPQPRGFGAEHSLWTPAKCNAAKWLAVRAELEEQVEASAFLSRRKAGRDGRYFAAAFKTWLRPSFRDSVLAGDFRDSWPAVGGGGVDTSLMH